MGLFDAQLNDVSEHFVDTFAGLSGIIFAEQFLLPRIARRLSCDVVFSTANYGPLNISNGVILLRNSLDVATVERRFRKLIYWGLIYVATMVSLLTARRVIAVSNYACNTSTRGVFEQVRKKVSIVPHGVSSAYSKIERKPSSKPFVLTVSDIYVQKNLHTLIKGFAVLLKDMPELTLKIAGKPLDASYYALVCRIVEEAKIAHAVEFLGHVSGEDLMSLYANCTVFVFPSTVETFGNPLVEAMASGCPIICANAAAMPEIAGDAVRYVDPTKSSDFTDALHEMINDETMRDVFSARARSRSKLYSWDQTAHLTLGVLRDVAKKT